MVHSISQFLEHTVDFFLVEISLFCQESDLISESLNGGFCLFILLNHIILFIIYGLEGSTSSDLFLFSGEEESISFGLLSLSDLGSVLVLLGDGS
jgi:hypothetical protein